MEQEKEIWITKQYPWEAYPIGTKAQAISGGYWIKVQRGWKWFNGSTFPRPGADTNGKVCVPNKPIQLYGYKVGQVVWIKPVDAGDLKGKVKGFQMIDNHLPIVEFEYCGEKKFNAFDLQRISPYKKGKVKPVYIRVI